MQNQGEAGVNPLTNHMKLIDNEESQKLRPIIRDEQSIETDNDAIEVNKLETQQNQDTQSNNITKMKDLTDIQGSEDKIISENSPNSALNEYQSLMLQQSPYQGKFFKDSFKQDQQSQLGKSQSLFSHSHDKKQVSEREISIKQNGNSHRHISHKEGRRGTQNIRLQDQQNLKKAQLIQKIKKRMANFYKNFTNAGKKIYLEKRSVHTTLNDKSDGYFEIQQSTTVLKQALTFMKLLLSKIDSVLLSKIPVISSQSRINMFIKGILIIYNSFFFFLLSIIIVYQNMITQDYAKFYQVSLMIWTFEILIRLNTTTYKDSNILAKRKDIFFSYFPKKFIFDFISFLVLIILLLQHSPDEVAKTTIIIQIMCFSKIYNLNKDVEEFQKQLCMMLRRYYILKLSNLIIKLFVLAHIIACGWFIIATIEINWLGEQTTWYTESVTGNDTWWKVYILSMYWALTLMTTGSNEAKTLLQVSFTSFLMLFATIIIGYLLNTTRDILEEINASEENKRNDLNIINEYMREKNISINLQGRVNIYLEYYYQKNYQKQTDEAKNVLSKISTELRSLLQKEYFYQILTRIDFLHKNFSVQSLANLSVMCEEIVYYPNQIIFEENDFRDAALLVIIEGQVEIFQQVGLSKKDQKTICYLGQGQILGQINFFTGMVRTASARSKGFTKLAKISRDSFLQIASENEKDLQTFYQMKDNILLYENYEEMNIRCSACQSYKHLQGSCPLVHINKQSVKEKVRIFNIMKQDRKQLKRKVVTKGCTLKNLIATQEKIMSYQQAFIGNSIVEFNYLNQLEEESEESDNDDYDYDYDQKHDDQDDSHMQESQKGYSEEKKRNESNGIEEESSNQSYQSNLKDCKTRQTSINKINMENKQNHQKDEKNRSRRTMLSCLSRDEQISNFEMEYYNTQLFVVGENPKQQNDQQQFQTKILMNNFFEQDSNLNHQIIKNKKLSFANISIAQDLHLKNMKNKDLNTQKDARKVSIQKHNIPTLGQFDSDSSDQKSNKKSKQVSTLFDLKKKHPRESKRLKQKKNSEYFSQNIINSKFILPTTQSSQKIIEKKELDDFQEEKERMLWQLDKQKDYDFYFQHGNMKIRISQFNFYLQKKEQKSIMQFIQSTLQLRKRQHRVSTQFKPKKMLFRTQLIKPVQNNFI